MAKRRATRLCALGVPLGAVALWQLLRSTGVIGYEYLPAPSHIATALWELARTGELARDLSHTVGVALLAAVIVLPLGGAAGLAIGLLPAVRDHVLGSVDFLRTVPAVTLVPVALLTFGPVTATQLMLACYAALWPVVLNTAGGVAAVHPRQYDVARVLHLPGVAVVGKVVIPAVVPAWLVGARLAVVIALLVTIVSEMIMYPVGLGGGLVESLNALAPERMWAYALTCAGVGYLLNAGLRHLVAQAFPGLPTGRAGALPASVQPPVAQPAATIRGLLPVAALLVVWQVVGDSDSLSFPPPADWLGALRRLYTTGILGPAVIHTLTTYAMGLLAAVVVGGAAGAALGASRGLDRALTPSIDVIAAVPAAALVPVVVLIFGPDQLSGVVAVAVIVSWPILLNTVAAMRAVPAVRMEMARSLGLPTPARWTKVVLPSLAPGLMLGVRVASALALISTLLVDIFGTGAGIGRVLLESQQRFDASAAWGLLLIMGIIGYLTSACLARAGRLLAEPTGEQAWR